MLSWLRWYFALLCIFLSLYFCRNKNATQVTAVASAQVAEQEAAVAAAPDWVYDPNCAPDWVYDPNEPRYCLCNQVSPVRRCPICRHKSIYIRLHRSHKVSPCCLIRFRDRSVGGGG